MINENYTKILKIEPHEANKNGMQTPVFRWDNHVLPH